MILRLIKSGDRDGLQFPYKATQPLRSKSNSYSDRDHNESENLADFKIRSWHISTQISVLEINTDEENWDYVAIGEIKEWKRPCS
jgi:hypothetical protein